MNYECTESRASSSEEKRNTCKNAVEQLSEEIPNLNAFVRTDYENENAYSNIQGEPIHHSNLDELKAQLREKFPEYNFKK
ncbi:MULTISPECIES: hypothetical protein [Bacillaceae]|uniref:hypothetical protein n=1 Tax=Bacillaceae TaxID=186817 RepID=UPI0011A5D565|nr:MULTISPECIES: hypothetical protein [Bacillaceae]MED4473959.1 hypothetical protein [Oceanobacillus caeni]